MADLNGGQLAARQLQLAGVDTIFGVVAGPTIEFLSGAAELGLNVVGCRHEENAAFMASAWGYAKGKPGVIVTGSGPAMTNTVTPMHVATESAMPLVVLGGSTPSAQRGLGGFQECDQMAFAQPGCKWTRQADRTERIPELIYLALGKAVSGRPGAVYLDFPAEVVSRTVAQEKVVFRERAPEIARPAADASTVDRVADLLARAERPLVIVGKGAAWADARDSISRIVDCGIPYISSPMARGTLPDDHANFMNSARSTALKSSDVILMVGGRFNWIFSFGSPARFLPEVKLVQIDIVAEEMYSGANLEVGIVADADVACGQIADALEGRTLRSADGEWVKKLGTARDANEASLRSAMESEGAPIDPHRLIAEVRDVVPRDASITIEGETTMGIARQILPCYEPRAMFNAGTTGCMGIGVPYAIGAKLARPDAASVAVLGDYAFGSAAIGVETAMRIGAKVVFVVANNEGIVGHVLQDNLFPPGAPRIASLLPAHYEKMIEMVDGHAERVEKPGEIRPALERALAADTVSLVHVLTDPKASRLSGGVYMR